MLTLNVGKPYCLGARMRVERGGFDLLRSSGMLT